MEFHQRWSWQISSPSSWTPHNIDTDHLTLKYCCGTFPFHFTHTPIFLLHCSFFKQTLHSIHQYNFSPLQYRSSNWLYLIFGNILYWALLLYELEHLHTYYLPPSGASAASLSPVFPGHQSSVSAPCSRYADCSLTSPCMAGLPFQYQADGGVCLFSHAHTV